MNLQLLTDLYEFSMANGYYATLPHDRQARFDVFYRRVPDNGSFVIVAGLQQLVEQVQNWHFTKENIEYLTSLNEFTPEFLDYLSKIKYTKAFKKQFKKRRQDPKWRSIFKSSLPQEFDDQKRSPWKHIIQCLIEDKTIPDYFYPHTLEGVTMENQETTRKKKRFDMKRSFRRISAVIATMAFTTGLAACGSSQSTAPSANKATSSVTAPQGWKKFTSKDLGYSVYFPGVPEKDTYKDPTGAYARYSTVNDKDHINYAVSVTKFTRKQVEDSKGFNDAQKRKVLTNVARLLQIDKYSFTTVDGHMAISYTSHDSEDSSVIMRREVVYSSAGLYGLESFGTSSSEYKQFVDTFRLSEDTQE